MKISIAILFFSLFIACGIAEAASQECAVVKKFAMGTESPIVVNGCKVCVSFSPLDFNGYKFEAIALGNYHNKVEMIPPKGFSPDILFYVMTNGDFSYKFIKSSDRPKQGYPVEKIKTIKVTGCN